MRKIILSTNEDEMYSFFLPITGWVWKQFGYTPFSFVMGDSPKLDCAIEEFEKIGGEIYRLKPVEGYRDSTVIQASRLYASCITNGYLMIGDIDMFCLSKDYFDRQGMLLYGGDLMQYRQYPMCYIGMSSTKWREIMDLKKGNPQSFIERDLDYLEKNTNDFEMYWYFDQELITKRIREHGESKFQKIDRGQFHGWARGRVDRGNWAQTLNQDNYIDCHAMRRGNHKPYFDMNVDVIKKALPDKDVNWMYEYLNKYNSL